MHKPNAADDPRLAKDKRGKQPNNQYGCSEENVQVFLEVEVIDGLCAEMSRKNENPIDQSGVVEVTIIRPGTTDPFIDSAQNPVPFSTIEGRTEKVSELQYRAKPCGRPATKAVDRCRIPQLNRRRKDAFFPKNLIEGPAINVCEIVGDLPSEVRSKPRILVHENKLKIRHGDHCDSVISEHEIPCAEIDQRTIAVKLLKPYINFSNFETKVCEESPCRNPLVYQVHLESNVTREDHPLVEFSAAQKILETYRPDESSLNDDRHQVIEAMRKTLREWGSDEERIADTLYKNTSSLMRCGHCGVISFKKAQAPAPTTEDELSGKLHNEEQLRCIEAEKSPTTNGTAGSSCDPSKNDSNSKSSVSCTENEAAMKKSPEKSSEVKFHSHYFGPEPMRAERRSDFVRENMIRMVNVNQKKEFKSMLPLIPANKCGRCSVVAKNEKSNELRLRNTYSPRYSSRQVDAKTVKKPVRNTSRDNRNGNHLEIGNNSTKTWNKNSTPVSKECEATKPPRCKNDKMDDTKANDTGPKPKAAAEGETPLSVNASRKSKLARSLKPPFIIPTKLEKTGSMKPLSSKIVANQLAREKPSDIVGKERGLLQVDGKPSIRQEGEQSMEPSKNIEDGLQSKADLRFWKHRTLLAGGIQEDSQNDRANVNNPSRDLLQRHTVSSNDKSSTDQEYAVSNDRRSFHTTSTANSERERINPDFEYSAPLIGFPKKSFGNNDFVIDRYLADDNLPAEYNGESETTAFSSSSSDEANSFGQVPMSVQEGKNNERSSDTIQSIRAQINKAIEKCSNYNAGFSNVPLKLDQKKVSPNVHSIATPYERFKNTDCRRFSPNDTMPSTNAAQTVLLRLENDRRTHGFGNSYCLASTSDSKKRGERPKPANVSEKLVLADDATKMTTGFAKSTLNALGNDRKEKIALVNCRNHDNHDVHTTEEDKGENSQNSVQATAQNVAEKIRRGRTGIAKSQEKFSTSEGRFLNKQKDLAIRTAVDESSKDPLKMTYKNPTSVISSSSEYSNEYNHVLEDRQRSLCDEKGGSILQFNESEMFEHQITYDAISSKNISTGSKENMEAEALPIYRRILESKDEMDWETFQQLVGTLHPSQRELWCDICKAVSNEAKRVAGETGASTEVCIEINPIPTSRAFSCQETRLTGVETSDNEISFEMDMVLTDSETFSDQKSQCCSETLHEHEKCH